MTAPSEDRSDDSLERRLEALYDHLAATARFPIDPRTNRWLGEAEAVARDATREEIDPETARERVEQVRYLLSETGEPDHDEAAAHLEAARERCEEILSE